MKTPSMSLRVQAGVMGVFCALWTTSYVMGLNSGLGFVSNLALFWCACYVLIPVPLAVAGLVFGWVQRKMGVKRVAYYTGLVLALLPLLLCGREAALNHVPLWSW